jgi:ABC-type sugar transport system ATPase subunit
MSLRRLRQGNGLRDGKLSPRARLLDSNAMDLVCLMLGKQREDLEKKGATALGEHHEAQTAETLLETENLTRGRRIKMFSLRAGRGEILGMAGLLGSGRTEVARAVFGADEIDNGKVLLEGKPLILRSPTMRFAPASRFWSKTAKPKASFPIGLSGKYDSRRAARADESGRRFIAPNKTKSLIKFMRGSASRLRASNKKSASFPAAISKKFCLHGGCAKIRSF